MPIEFLTREDFSLAANTPNVNTTTAEFVIPRGYAYRFLAHAGRLLLGTMDQFAGTGAQTVFNLTRDIVPSRGNGPAAIDGALVTVNGALVAITSIDYAANSVTLTVAPANAATVKIYYAFSEGRYTVEVFSADERRHDTHANGAIRRLNASNQEDVNQLFRLKFATNWLPQDFIIRVQVQTAATINWDTVNPFSMLQLPYERRDIRTFRPEELIAAYQSLG
ncbi:MAG: hypothetical protein WDA16_05915 [Candidatus Thermoplasmatota archaeon]